MADSSEDEKRIVQIEVNPEETTLEELLRLAEIQKANIVAIKGETDSGEVQWGCVITCGDNAGDAMRVLEVAVDATVANWLSAKMN